MCINFVKTPQSDKLKDSADALSGQCELVVQMLENIKPPFRTLIFTTGQFDNPLRPFSTNVKIEVPIMKLSQMIDRLSKFLKDFGSSVHLSGCRGQQVPSASASISQLPGAAAIGDLMVNMNNGPSRFHGILNISRSTYEFIGEILLLCNLVRIRILKACVFKKSYSDT